MPGLLPLADAVRSSRGMGEKGNPSEKRKKEILSSLGIKKNTSGRGNKTDMIRDFTERWPGRRTCLQERRQESLCLQSAKTGVREDNQVIPRRALAGRGSINVMQVANRYR